MLQIKRHDSSAKLLDLPSPQPCSRPLSLPLTPLEDQLSALLSPHAGEFLEPSPPVSLSLNEGNTYTYFAILGRRETSP